MSILSAIVKAATYAGPFEAFDDAHGERVKRFLAELAVPETAAAIARLGKALSDPADPLVLPPAPPPPPPAVVIDKVREAVGIDPMTPAQREAFNRAHPHGRKD